MIISISGVPGSGKTSVAKIIAKRLGYRFYSMGDLRGKMALERGMSLDELNKLGEADDSIDKSVDDYQRELGQKEDNFVIEGRLSWHFIPHSFKVFLACDSKVAARRIFMAHQMNDDERRDETKPTDLEETERLIASRLASDALRYKKYYGVDYQDPAHYDLVVDTVPIPDAAATADAVRAALPPGLEPISKS